jgi:alpha-1,3-mannosyltransferase
MWFSQDIDDLKLMFV